MNTRLAMLTLLTTSTALAGCHADAVPLSEVLNYGNCSGLTAGIRTVTLDEVAKLRGMTMIGGASDAGTKDTVDQTGMPVLIAISRGEQPTAGYSFALPQGHMQEGTLHIELEWKVPAAGEMTAQMITHPCLVVSLPDPAPAAVEVTTTAGESIGRLSLPH